MRGTARDLLRDAWRHGVRVRLLPDRLRLEPPWVAPEPLRSTLRDHAAEVAEILAGLPCPDRCAVCGEGTQGPAGNSGQLHCAPCALIAADRLGLRILRGEESEAVA